MTINIGSSSINSIYIGDTEVKSVYLGDNLVYSRQTEPEVEIDDSYNYFVFDTSKVSDSTTVILQKYRAGDTTEWDSLTYWGDGTVDSKLSHKYAKNGTYIVKTKYVITKPAIETEGSHSSIAHDSNTQKMLIQCLNINKNMTIYKYFFYSCTNLTYVNTLGINTSNTTDLSWMFGYCESLTSLDLSRCDTSNVTNMRAMFYQCKKIVSPNLSGWDTRNVTDMSAMFMYCNELSSLDLSSFYTSKVTDMRNMFFKCNELSSLDLSHWDMRNVTDYTNMFFGCYSLTRNNVIMTNCLSSTKTKIQEALYNHN